MEFAVNGRRRLLLVHPSLGLGPELELPEIATALHCLHYCHWSLIGGLLGYRPLGSTLAMDRPWRPG